MKNAFINNSKTVGTRDLRNRLCFLAVLFPLTNRVALLAQLLVVPLIITLDMASDRDLHKHKLSNQRLFTSNFISCVTPSAFVHFTRERRHIYFTFLRPLLLCSTVLTGTDLLQLTSKFLVSSNVIQLTDHVRFTSALTPDRKSVV